MCRGAHDYRCWNAITVDGPLAADKLVEAIRHEIASLPDFDPVLLQAVQRERQTWGKEQVRWRHEHSRQQADIRRQLDHILGAIKQAGSSPTLLEELHRLERRKAEIEEEMQVQDSRKEGPLAVPSMPDIKALAAQAFGELAVTSQEFGRLLRRLIRRIVVLPYRLCDGGHPVLLRSSHLQPGTFVAAGAGVGSIDLRAKAIARGGSFLGTAAGGLSFPGHGVDGQRPFSARDCLGVGHHPAGCAASRGAESSHGQAWGR